jgi:hypothetical protein
MTMGQSRGAANLGAGALNRGRDARWEVGEVVMYHSATHSADLRCLTGRKLKDVPQLRPGASDYEHLKTGTVVVVSYDLGFTPIIIGTLNLPGDVESPAAPTDIIGVANVGSDNPIQPTQGSHNFRPASAPTDLTQGDWARTGSLGNFFALLEGGVTAMGAPTAQVRSLALAGLLQFIGQRVHTITDFGEWKTTNDQGRTSFTLRAGSNQATQTGLDEQHWTFNLDMGALGDLFRFEIVTPNGATLFRLYVGPDGRTQLFGAGGLDLSSGSAGDSEQVHTIEGDEITTVGGDSSKEVDGDTSLNIKGAYVENVAMDRTGAVGNDASNIVNRNETNNIGGQLTEVIAGGDPTLATPGNVAVSTTLLNGGWVVDIGNPSKGANISAQAAFNLKTSLGDISFDSGGRFSVSAKQNVSIKSETITDIDGQQVNLGGIISPAPIWNKYLPDLITAFTAIGTALTSQILGPALVGGPPANVILQEFIGKLSASINGAPYSSTKVHNG